MAVPPHLILKVHDKADKYVAALQHPEAAAAVVAVMGAGATILHGGHGKVNVVWTEGSEDKPAAGNFPHVAQVIAARLKERAKAKTDAEKAKADKAKERAAKAAAPKTPPAPKAKPAAAKKADAPKAPAAPAPAAQAPAPAPAPVKA